MTSMIDIEAKNVDQAVRKACDELQIEKDKLKYEILSHGSSGIFGLVQVKKAKIRVFLPQTKAPDAKRPEAASFRKDELPSSSEKESPKERSAPEASAGRWPDSPEELGRDALQRIVDFITDDAQVNVTENDDGILLDVAGGDAGVLIGKRGQTLEAIQSLVEKIVNKRNGDPVRIKVDVAGYLETRKNNLRKMAFKLARKAKRSGKPVSLGQMNSYERRIIHLALKGDPQVRTQSRGEGYWRKLVIYPSQGPNRARSSTN
jgi:spoIIIJ-associated protein